MIRLEGVTVQVGSFTLEEVSLVVPAGGYGLIIGPTGSGKTTLLEAIAGHEPLRRGRIALRDEDVTAAAPEARRVGFVYQHYHLFPHLTVGENIGYGLRREAPDARAGRIRELAETLGLVPLLPRSVRGLSGGEQQRIALARALASRPNILLLDEPFAAVDPATRRVLRRELRALHEREGITTLQVTHDFEDAMRLGDVVAVLAEGRIAQSGTPDAVFRYPNSAFVAEFIGTGTVLRGTVERMAQSSRAAEPPSQAAEQSSRAERGDLAVRFAGLFRSGNLSLEVVAEREGEAYAVIRPADLLLSLSEGHEPAPRNRFPATITRVERGSAVAQVQLDAGGTALVAAVMSSTAEELGLAPGVRVAVAIKATAIHLI
ncbi:MAG TPA: ABC transporter ATP-binding protein [Gemmatimonadales bacterium]|nr:ABC transporter ATP-binding protein [Gemmatimonadales bacterium]